MNNKYLYKYFKFHGYYVFYCNIINISNNKEIDSYINLILENLNSNIQDINSNHMNNGFIDFGKSTLLEITRFDRYKWCEKKNSNRIS